MNDNSVSLDEVGMHFGDVPVLDGFSLEIRRGEFVALVGPSGCGKTTILNLISGFLHPSHGVVVRRGHVRAVYQEDGLFPWLTTSDNIALGLRHGHAVARRQTAQHMIRLVGLSGFESHYPHQLSGGMRRRAELARVLTGDTDILLMDEPFSSLDYLTRLRLRQELARLLEERPRTVVMVTHDVEEAAQLADRVVVLSDRPARIRCELRPDSLRPREPTQRPVVDTVHRMLHELGFHDPGGAGARAPMRGC